MYPNSEFEFDAPGAAVFVRRHFVLFWPFEGTKLSLSRLSVPGIVCGGLTVSAGDWDYQGDANQLGQLKVKSRTDLLTLT